MDGVGYTMTLVKREDESIRVHSDKMKRGQGFADFLLDFETVTLPGLFDEMGEPMTTGVLVPSSRSVQTNGNLLTRLQQTFLEHLEKLGGVHVSRSELMAACKIDKDHQSGFSHAALALIDKGYITEMKQGKQKFYSLVRNHAE